MSKKPLLTMTDAELDAELRENGIDPNTLMDSAFHKVCTLAANQRKRIAALETERDQLELRAIDAEGSLWRIGPDTHTIGGKPDPFEGPGETYHDAYLRVAVERDALKAQLERVVFDRTDNALPTTKCLTLLSNGFISVGKACEWLAGYFATGVEQPIADEQGQSVWDEIKTLKAQLEDEQREKHKIRAMLATNENLAFRYKQQVDRLLIAAQAVIDRWMTPSWRGAKPTAQVIYALANAVSETRKEQA